MESDSKKQMTTSELNPRQISPLRQRVSIHGLNGPVFRTFFSGSVNVLHSEDLQPLPECCRHPPRAIEMDFVSRNGLVAHHMGVQMPS